MSLQKMEKKIMNYNKQKRNKKQVQKKRKK